MFYFLSRRQITGAGLLRTVSLNCGHTGSKAKWAGVGATLTVDGPQIKGDNGPKTERTKGRRTVPHK